MSIQFRCASCQATIPLASVLDDNRCPECKQLSLSAIFIRAKHPAPLTRETGGSAPIPNAGRPAKSRKGFYPGYLIAASMVGATLSAAIGLGIAHQARPSLESSSAPPTVESRELEARLTSDVAVAPAPAPAPVEPPAAAPDNTPPATEPAAADPVQARENKANPAPPEAPAPAPLAPARPQGPSEDDLRKQLLRMRELNLTDIFSSNRPDFCGLPIKLGPGSQRDKDSAEGLQLVADKVRHALKASKPSNRPDGPSDPILMRALLLGENPTTLTSAQKLQLAAATHTFRVAQGTVLQVPLHPQSVPALMQILQAEDAPVRRLLVDILQKIPGSEASTALAHRALFELSVDVRAAAVAALRHRPTKEFRAVLANGLRYPWAPVADHAAAAFIALEDVGSVPDLVGLLRLPDPTAAQGEPTKRAVVREIVRINHLSNCLMCHPISGTTTEVLRKPVPSLWREQGSAVVMDQIFDAVQIACHREVYFTRKTQRTTIFVRADATYLRPDFSVPLSVTTKGPWPGIQRYDYVTRLRAAMPAEIGNVKRDYPQREAVLLALRGLTGANEGSSAEKWEEWVARNQGLFTAR